MPSLVDRTACASLLAVALTACASGQPFPEQPRRGGAGAGGAAVDVNLSPATVRRSDTAADEAPPTGTPETRAARRAIDAQHAAVAQCYNTVLGQSPDAAGRMVVDVTFGPNGAAQRANARVEGEGRGLGNARACVEAALRGARIQGGPRTAIRARRTYTFVNAPIEITVATPMAITPPIRGATRPEPPQPGSDGGQGALNESEVANVVSGYLFDIQACYGTLLRTQRNAAGAATANFVVGGDGAVSEATITGAQPPLDGMNDCLSGAFRGMRFRASGTRTTVHFPLDFARQ